MRRREKTGQSGATLHEVMVATGVFMVILAALITGVTSLQKCYSNTTAFAANHSAELRISDYIGRDLRQALSFSQTGTGNDLVLTMTVPNYFDSAGSPRMPVINTDGTVSYQDASVSPVRKTSTVTYFIRNRTVYRQVDSAARPIADNVQNFLIVALDSATDANAITDFNLSGVTTRVAQVRVQVNFSSQFGRVQKTQTFSTTTLMRNARTDSQTNLY